MSSPRKFVVPALMVALWVATCGFVPRAAEAFTTTNDAQHACVHLDGAASHTASFAAAEATYTKQVKNEGVDVDEDGPDVVSCEVPGTLPVAATSASVGEHRDSAYVRAHWVSLSARGPPQS